MNTLQLSILIGVSSALICTILLSSKEPEKDETQKRLDKIKRKSFESEKEIKERISLLVNDTTYKIQFIGHILKNFSFSEKIKNSLNEFKVCSDKNGTCLISKPDKEIAKMINAFGMDMPDLTTIDKIDKLKNKLNNDTYM